MDAARVGIITFPGSLDDKDAARAVRLSGAEPVALWHGDHDLQGVDAVVLPGGFSYGDYLRAGAIARFAPLMTELVAAAGRGCPCSASATASRCCASRTCCRARCCRTVGLHFVCRDQRLRVENADTAWTSEYGEGQELVIPIKNRDGRYTADRETLIELADTGRIVARYVDLNPNGSLDDIVSICNEVGNVVGLMPHPEHAVESLTGPSTDGLGFFTSIVKRLVNA